MRIQSKIISLITIITTVFLFQFQVHSVKGAVADNAYHAWKRGPSSESSLFPIAVWLQNPANASRYKSAGFNLYIGLWNGPTEDQLSRLKAAGMRVICSQNSVALKHLDDETIAGWMHGDEPDNAQSLGRNKGYGPPILPARIVEDYQRIQKNDPSRPILLNLGQGVAWDRWHGRGTRTNHPEDYPEYVKGGDIISFDIYPAVHDHPDVAGNLYYVPRGVERLVSWTEGKKIIWNCIECTHISNPKAKATPHQVRAEVWMSLIHGSQGLIYFVHEFQPKFNESALLSDPEMLSAVTAINHQIIRLAPVLNQRSISNLCKAIPNNPDIPVATMVKQWNGATYLFAVCMRNAAVKCRFELPTLPKNEQVEVLDEKRKLAVSQCAFSDEFEPWATHIYILNL